MPIQLEVLRADLDAAKSFLNGLRGTILHEIAHYVAGNAKRLLGGHLIIEKDGRTGAFRPHVHYWGRFLQDLQQVAFLIAAAGVAELYFCYNTHLPRLGTDIRNYRQIVPGKYDSADASKIVTAWQHFYWKKIEALSECIQYNFDICEKLCSSKEYLFDGYHVIPTAVFKPPVTRDWREHFREVYWTGSMAARRDALDKSPLRIANEENGQSKLEKPSYAVRTSMITPRPLASVSSIPARA
jgi:hypothetical protein